MKIVHVVGARPNFMKMAPVFNALKKYPAKQLIIHTGQHYSQNMSDIFFEELGINPPDINLQVGSGSHANQVAQIMMKFEEVMLKENPDLIVVYGDVNSTMAAALVGAKLGIKIAHVEAGLRSFDLSMPEEINRIVTDRLSSLFFIHSPEAEENLLKENVSAENIYLVGNVMIDTLLKYLEIIKERKKMELPFAVFGLVTLHRPSNVDDPERLKKIILSLNRIAQKIPLVFPIHPRTKKQLEQIEDIKLDQKNILLIDPLGYLDFLSLVYRSKFVITDSGGIQEETTYLGIPCLTLRSNTERPITVSEGTSTLIGDNYQLLEKKIDEIVAGNYKQGKIPKNWDGQAAERIAKIIT
jgi:UDP-N-acetylglucosamine 2-epimerase (non-hydrolysing)